VPMSVSVRILQLLQECADAASAGDHARTVAAAREALASPDSRALPGLVDIFRQVERLSMASADPQLVSQLARVQEDATQSSVCGFCGRSNNDVPRLVAGGTGLVCTDCVTECIAVLSGGVSGCVSIAEAPFVGDTGGCSFCGAADVKLAAGGVALICERCVRRIQAALDAGTI
jgi:hypothetical protein